LELEGEGNKSKFSSEGEGLAFARKTLFEAIGDQPANLQKEILHTLREMAKGTSNTILFPIPSKLTDVLEDIFGGKKENGGYMDFRKLVAGLSDDKKKFLYDLLDEWVKKGDKK
jgi:hypothetical protein